MATVWQRTGVFADADSVARRSQPSAFSHTYYPTLASEVRRWHQWEASRTQHTTSNRNTAVASSPSQCAVAAVVYPGAGSSARTQPHVVDADHNTDHRSVSREAFLSNQRAHEATPVSVFGGPERYDRARGDLLRREDHAQPPVTTDGYRDPDARSPFPPRPAVLPPPELYSRTPDEDVFDASVRFLGIANLAFTMAIAVAAVVVVAFGVVSAAWVRLASFGAAVTCYTLAALASMSVTRIHVERVTTAGTNNAPYGGGGTAGEGADADAWRNRRVRVVSYRLPCLCREERELRVCDITGITVGDPNRDINRRKACCHHVVYAHVAAPPDECPSPFPVYVGTDTDEQAELWLNYLGLPPRGTV